MSLDSGPIQTPAPGFLSLLNLKNKGLLPDVLKGNLQPVVDLADYFARGAALNITTNYTRVQAAAAVTGLLAFNTPSATVVPQTDTSSAQDVTVRALATGAGAALAESGSGSPPARRGNASSAGTR